MQCIHSLRLEITETGHICILPRKVSAAFIRLPKRSMIKKRKGGIMDLPNHYRYYQIYALIKPTPAKNCIPLAPCRTAFTKLCFGHATRFHWRAIQETACHILLHSLCGCWSYIIQGLLCADMGRNSSLVLLRTRNSCASPK